MFRVRHPVKQRLILKALEAMSSIGETTEETQAINDMTTELYRLLERRKRHVHLTMKQWVAPKAGTKKRPA